MKLRNKKTGETGYLELEKGDNEKYIGFRVYKNDFAYKRYGSLIDLSAEWEDYTPTEPLIKDEKIRKAVRAWAEANEVFGATTYKSCSDGHYWYIRAFNDTERGIDIDLWGELPKELIDCKYYTIAELCGEEK